jgi:hypothetical protein
MSIIYDALKKVENANAENTKAETEKQDPAFKPKRKNYLVYLLVACLGLFIGNLFFGFLTPSKKSLQEQITPFMSLFSKDKSAKDAKKKTGPALIVAPASRPQPQKKAESPEGISALFSNIRKEAEPSLVLNGIFFSDDEGYALINNQIVGVGDEVSGATVKSITVDEVELDKAGSIVKLSTRGGG